MSSYDDDQNLRVMSCAFSLNYDTFQSLAKEIIKIYSKFKRNDSLILVEDFLIGSC